MPQIELAEDQLESMRLSDFPSRYVFGPGSMPHFALTALHFVFAQSLTRV
jgi:hypothetical protein